MIRTREQAAKRRVLFLWVPLVLLLLALALVTQACAFHEGTQPAPPSGQAKIGLPAANFYLLDSNHKLMYLSGVADTLDFLGIKCPMGKAPSYNQAIVLTETYIMRHHDYARSMWAAAAYLGVLNELGCKRE